MKAKYVFISVILVLAVCGIAQAATKVVEWKFENNLSDTSGNGINADPWPNSSSILYTTGVDGQCFDGNGVNSAFKLGISTAILPVLAADTWSVNVWVRPNAVPGDWHLAWALGQKPTGGSAINSRTIYSPAAATIVFTDGKGSSFLSTSIPWEINQWQMITTTYDGAKVRVYKNGILIGLKSWIFADAPGEIRMASYAWGNTISFNGDFDEFTVWRGALTPQEIVDMIIPGVIPGYQAIEEKVYYTMDDPCTTAWTLPDHSGNSNTGVLEGYSTPVGNWVAPGEKGAALLFDGAQRINLPANMSISQNAQHSVVFWFKSGKQPYYTAFYSEVSPTEPGSRLMIRGDAGTDGTIKAYSNDRYYGVQYSLTYNASEYMDSTYWHHFALTTDGDVAKIYIDGEVVTSSPVLAFGGKKTDMNASVGYNRDPSCLEYLGDWDKTYMDDFHMYRGALTQEDVQALYAKGNIDNDFDVDLTDLAGVAEKWLTNSTSVAGTTLMVDNMEGSLANWSVVDATVIDPYYTGTGTISSTTNAYTGSLAMQWNYSLPARSGGNYSSIKYSFAVDKDLTSYDAMRLPLYRHAGNTPESDDGLMFVNFYAADNTLLAKVYTFEDPNVVVLPAGQWEAWYINLNTWMHGLGEEDFVKKDVLTNVRYVVIGCGSSREDARTGAIDFDEVKFIKNPICSPYLAADVDSYECKDCKVDFRDFAALAEDWLLGVQ